MVKNSCRDAPGGEEFLMFSYENRLGGGNIPKILGSGGRSAPCALLQILRNIKEYHGILSEWLQGTHRAGRSWGGRNISEVP